jgi:hypothetical protein
LQQRFAEWMRKLPIPSGGTAKKRLAVLDADALFFNFNYTPVRWVRCVRRSFEYPEQILFIHGCAVLADNELGWGMRGIR